MESITMTAEELENVRRELGQLESAGRSAMASRIKTAREWGDLKENAEYHAAKEAQAHLETRIARLRDRLSKAEVVEVAGGDTVGFGSTVEIEDEQAGRRATYKLVSAGEAAPSEGRLSMQSPVAAALQGLRAGDQALVETPRGKRRYRVLSVS